MEDKKYVDGFRFFDRKDNQPDFVLGAIVLTPEDLTKWAMANRDKVSEYKGKDQIKFQVKRSKEGKVYVELDTWKPGNGVSVSNLSGLGSNDENLPF